MDSPRSACQIRRALRRVWRVEVSPETGRLHCRAPSCPGTTVPAVRAAALEHLAAHARGEPLADYLRTCRCHAHGCTWHPRHRGCTGPIRLVLLRLERGRVWQLADMCTGCARAVPDAAEVPDAPPPAPLAPHSGHVPRRARNASATAATAGFAAALHYLDAALPADTSPGAVLLALVSLLRANRDGTASLPAGLLRALRLGHDADKHLAELVGSRWLQPDPLPLGRQPELPGGGWAVRIADLTACPSTGMSRRARRRLFGHITVLLRPPDLRAAAAARRLAALRHAAAEPSPNETEHPPHT